MCGTRYNCGTSIACPDLESTIQIHGALPETNCNRAVRFVPWPGHMRGEMNGYVPDPDVDINILDPIGNQCNSSLQSAPGTRSRQPSPNRAHCMSGQVIDPFHNTNVKYPAIVGHCPLYGTRLNMLKEHTCTEPDNLSTDTFGGDTYIENAAEISFEISPSKRLRVFIGEYTGTVRRVSGFPGTDRILRPSDRRAVPSGQRRFYQKLTQFLNGKKVYVTGTFNCYTALTHATEHDYDIKIDGDRPFPVSVDHSEINLMGCPQLTFNSIRDENALLYHPHGPNMVNISDAGDSICYFGTSVDGATGQRCDTCDSPTLATRVWQKILFDGTGVSPALFYPDCIESMRRMSNIVSPQDMPNWKQARIVLTPLPELYVSETCAFAEQVIYGEDVMTRQGHEISRVPTREEQLLRVVDDGRSHQSTPKDVCMVYRNSEPNRYRKDLLKVGDMVGIFYAGGYSHPNLDVPRRWNIVNDVAWPSLDGTVAEPLPGNVLVGGEGHRS